MKKLLAALAVAALFVLPVAGVATANSGPTMSQFKALKRQVTQIDKQVTNLENRIAALEAAPTVACLGTIPVAQFDDYLADDGFTSISGLDIDDSAPDWNVVTKIC